MKYPRNYVVWNRITLVHQFQRKVSTWIDFWGINKLSIIIINSERLKPEWKISVNVFGLEKKSKSKKLFNY